MKLKAANIYLALVPSLFLLVVPPGGYFVISGFKFAVFAVLSSAFIIITIWELRRNYNSIHQPLKLTFIKTAVWLYMLFSTVSVALSEYGAVTILGAYRYEGILTIVLYGLVFLLLPVFIKPAGWQLWIFGASITVMCVIILIQLYGYNPFMLYPKFMTYYDSNILYSDKYVGTVGNAGLTAAVLSVSDILFALTVIRFGGRKWLCAIPVLFASYILGRLGIDAGILSVVIAMVIVMPAAVTDIKSFLRMLAIYPLMLALIFYWQMTFCLWVVCVLCLGTAWLLYKYERPMRRPKLCMWVLVIMISAAVFTIVWFYNGTQYGTIYEANRLLHGIWSDDFGNGRLYIWREVWNLVKEKPLFGGGPDTLGLRGLEPYPWYSEEGGKHILSYITAAHNEYLNVLVNQGIFAALCFIYLPFALLVKLYRSKNNTVIIASGAALCYAVEAFFGISMCASAIYFWILLAFADKG